MKLTALVLGALMLAAQAQATVVYSWVPVTQSPAGRPGTYSIATMVFNDAVVASGHYSLTEHCDGLPCSVNGDPSMVAITLGIGGQPSALSLVDLNVAFNADETLSGLFEYTDAGADFFLTGSGLNWSGTMNSDWIACSPRCAVTGYWVDPVPQQTNAAGQQVAAVPESPTVLMVASGLFFIFMRGLLRVVRRT